jgi:hypothetical protein
MPLKTQIHQINAKNRYKNQYKQN